MADKYRNVESAEKAPFGGFYLRSQYSTKKSQNIESANKTPNWGFFSARLGFFFARALYKVYTLYYLPSGGSHEIIYDTHDGACLDFSPSFGRSKYFLTQLLTFFPYIHST